MSDADRERERGAIEVLGVALLLGIVILGSLLVVVLGGQAISRDQQAVEVAQAEHSLAQLDSKASRVAFGSETSQYVDLGMTGNGGTLTVSPDRGRIRVTYVDVLNGTSETVLDTSLGAVVSDHGRTEIAYQGGGVWRRDGAHSIPLARPEFHYNDDTLTLPVVRLAGGTPVHSDVVVSDAGPGHQHFPNASANLTNKLSNAKIVVTVQSRYYEGWGQFFEQQTNGTVAYDHDGQRVTVTLLAVPEYLQPSSGIIATSGPGRIALKGTGSYVDSYNSSQGTYAETANGNGTVEAVGDVTLSGDSTIDGNVRSGGYVGVESSSGTVDGDVYWTEGFENHGTVTGANTSIPGVASLSPITGYVDSRVGQVRQHNDNDQTALVTDASLTGSGELGPGDYYFERLDLTGRHLTVNATGGNVTIAVQDWVRIQKDGGTAGNLTVRGDGRVRLLVQGQEEVSVSPTGLGERLVNFHVGKKSSVHVPGEDSRRLQILGPDSFNVTVTGSNGNTVDFDGIVYAPSGERGSGYTYIKQADVYGAVVTGNLTLGQYGAVHFDYALHDARLPLSPTISRIEYLHVATHPIAVTAD